MPELPDIVAYVDALRPRVVGCGLKRATIASPFLLRSVDPPIADVEGRRASGVGRLGKRIIVELDGEIFLVFHLMIAGRFRWGKAAARPVAKIGLAAFEFAAADAERRGASGGDSKERDGGTLLLTEASQKKRASLHVVRGRAALREHDPGGIELLSDEEIAQAGAPDELRLSAGDRALFEAFAAALRRENHTVKRSLTDPRLFSGVGNAYSDEILHAAHMSPLTLTAKMDDAAVLRLLVASRRTLLRWIAALRADFAGRFPGPGEITAFRPGFAVHGKFGQACPVCDAPVQRIRYAENETNYCPGCQTEGKILADRSLSRLLRDDWPRTLEELE